MQVDELLKMARKGKLDELESAWTSALDQDGVQIDSLLDVPAILVEREQTDLAESLLWYLIDSLREGGDVDGALHAARRGGRLLPDSEAMRDLLAELYVAVYGGDRDIVGLVESTLREPTVPLDQAVKCMDRILSFQTGEYVLDPQHGKVGRVGSAEAAEGKLVVDFGEGQKAYGPALVGRLEPVKADDFRALSTFERDKLAALAEDDPEELVRIVLATLDRRMELRRLRIYLAPVVGTWTKWWSQARDVLKRSSVIGMTAGRSPSLFLRAKPLSHAQRMVQRIRSAAGVSEKLATALDVLREMDRAESPDAEPLQAAVDEVAGIAREAAGERPALLLAALAVADAFRRQFAAVRPPDELPEAPVSEVLADPASLPAAVESDQVRRCALDYVHARAPEAWPDLYAAVMPLCGRVVCESAARRLRAAGAQAVLATTCQEILVRSDRNPSALAWLWRQAAASPTGDAAGGLDPAAVALEVLLTAAGLVRKQGLSDDRRKQQIGELRSALFMRSGGPLGSVLRSAAPEQVAAIRSVGENNLALTPRMCADLVKMLHAVQPSLFERSVPPWQQKAVYATAEGIEKRKADLEHIVHVRLPRVIREIGQAAGFGDLSDNAEYSAAVQERARLAERAGRIQEEIAGARLISPEVASADHVTVGSRVRARNLATEQIETMTFLGPWDAQPERSIYAYNAPLGLAFMGKQVGDTVGFGLEAEERNWEVVEITPAV